MATKINRNSKSVLAKVLACEDIMVTHSDSAKTASFDIRNRILVLPVFKETMSNELYDMLVAHEVGHALYTPYSEADEKSVLKGGHGKIADEIGGSKCSHIAFDYLNVIEDARIDRLMKAKFNGIARDYHIGYGELYEKDFFGTRDTNIDDMSFIDRINLHFKIGTSLTKPIRFNSEEQKFVDRIATCVTFDDVVAVTKDIWNYCNIQPPDEEGNEPNKIRLDGQGNSSGSSKTEQNGTANVISDEEKTGDSSGTSSNSSEENSENNTKTENSNKISNKNGQTPADCKTQKNFKSKQNDLIDLNKKTITNIIPKLNLDNTIVPFSQILNMFVECERMTPSQYEEANKQFKEFENNSRQSVGILQKQFLMKKAAKESNRAMISKTGIIDTNALVNYKFTDDIFLRIKNTKKGKSHGLVFFMDWSGSMAHILGDTVKQMLQILIFCRKMNIPFTVYAFSSLLPENIVNEMEKRNNYDPSHQWESISVTDEWGYKSRYNMSGFSLLEIFSSKMRNDEFNSMMKNMFAVIGQADAKYSSSNYYTSLPNIMHLSGTPLNEAIVAAMDIVPMFKSNNRLDIVHAIFLTDGESNGSTFYTSFHGRSATIVRGRYSYEMEKNVSSTDCLIDMLQDICGCKAIGIFLDSKRKGEMSSHTISRYFGYTSAENLMKQNKFYQEEGFAIADKTSHKYEELFIIRGNSEVEDDDLEDVLSSKKSTLAIRNAFIKTMENKISSRIMLNRFIDLIATE